MLVEQWRPDEVTHSLPSGIRWPVPALDLLSNNLIQWARKHGLAVYAYTAQEVRESMAGHPNASRDQLAYAVMACLGLSARVRPPMNGRPWPWATTISPGEPQRPTHRAECIPAVATP